VAALIAIYHDHWLVYLNKEMWGQAMANTISQPETPHGRHYSELDERLAAQVCELIVCLQRQDLVKRDVDARAVGETIFNNTNMMFTVFVKNEAMSLADLKAAILRQLAPLLVAIRR